MKAGAGVQHRWIIGFLDGLKLGGCLESGPGPKVFEQGMVVSLQAGELPAANGVVGMDSDDVSSR